MGGLEWRWHKTSQLHRAEATLVAVKDAEGDGEHRMSFDEFCSSGGIVNAYNALKLAATY